MDARLDAVERGLEAVSRLSSATAKGQGKERSQRLVLVLATGSFRERVVALVDKWNTGVEAARAGAGSGASASGGGDRPEPLKCQLWAAVAEQLVERGVGEPLSGAHFWPPLPAPSRRPSSSRHRMQTDRSRSHSSSRATWRGSHKLAVAKSAEGVWPPCGLKSGRYTPGTLHRAVLEECLGHTAEEVTTFFKGKGKGGRGPPPGLGARKRGAQQRLSVTAQHEPKLGKR